MSRTAGDLRSVWIDAVTHPGLARQRNEDALGSSGWTAQGTVSLLSHRYSGECPVVCAVADGLGGHPAGDVASASAVSWLVHGRPPERVEELVQLIASAHERVLEAGRASSEWRGMATTVAVLVATMDTVLCANVGDSRVYEIADGKAMCVSFDDRPAARPGAEVSSLVTQALGGTATPDPHPQWFVREAGLRFLLCSDGVSNLLSDAEIGGLFASAPSGADALTNLVRTCLDRGAPDNITALHVRIDTPDPEASSHVALSRIAACTVPEVASPSSPLSTRDQGVPAHE